jgi:endonuclease-3
MKLNPVELLLVNNPIRDALLRNTVGWLHEAACAPPVGRVLEIGCGQGDGVREIARRFRPAAIDAFDLDPKQVARARARLGGADGASVRLWVGDAERIAAAAGAYDAVVELTILPHVPDWRGAAEVRGAWPGLPLRGAVVVLFRCRSWSALLHRFTVHPGTPCSTPDLRRTLQEVNSPRSARAPAGWHRGVAGAINGGAGHRVPPALTYAPSSADGRNTPGRVVARLRAAEPAWNATALAEVADTTARDPFRILVACLLSLRTRDETTGPAAARLFALADTPAAMLALTPRRIERAVFPVGFYRTKARTILRVCRHLLARHGGRVPSDLETLLALPGVGRKTANLVVTFAFGLPGICVDTHVHRISNRLGFVATRTPDQTELALRSKLPRRHWIALNDLLVAFGQNVCQPLSPRCSACPVRGPCHRVGVVRSR